MAQNIPRRAFKITVGADLHHVLELNYGSRSDVATNNAILPAFLHLGLDESSIHQLVLVAWRFAIGVLDLD